MDGFYPILSELNKPGLKESPHRPAQDFGDELPDRQEILASLLLRRRVPDR